MLTIRSLIYVTLSRLYILRHRVSLHTQTTVGLTAERGSGSDQILKCLIHSDTERERERERRRLNDKGNTEELREKCALQRNLDFCGSLDWGNPVRGKSRAAGASDMNPR